MLRIVPGEIPDPKLHHYLLGSIAPRPVAFASTMDAGGNANLSPFSFFNAFGVNPTTLIFSPSRRGRDNTTKDTYDNLKEVPEVVINVVTYEMVNQVSLSSTDYPKGVDEFVKAGFTKMNAEKVRPYRVKESPVQMECKVRDIIETGQGGGSANLVICEILVMHVAEEVLNEKGLIDQEKIRLVGRLGGNYYVRGFGEALFKVEKPSATLGIGIDALPDKIKFNRYLTGNDLGRLGNLESLPGAKEIEAMRDLPGLKEALKNPASKNEGIHRLARKLMDEGKVNEALKVLMWLD